MQGNRPRDTKPELAVRRAAFALGLRYVVDRKPLADHRRTADLVFTRARVAVFIDGCFWHGCPAHGSRPKANVEYWEPKLAGNRKRDAQTDALLRAAGWIPLRFWAHEDPETVAAHVAEVVAARRPATR
jgi:DNA mismatch endonuclease (patch repair protein)